MEKQRKSSFREAMGKFAGIFRKLSENRGFDDWRRLGGLCLLAYLLDLAIAALFLTEVKEWSAGTWVLMLASLPVYALAYTAPGAVLTLLVYAVCAKCRRARLVVAAAVGALLFSATQLLLLADFGLLRNFGYHFNRFVWNLLTTPGGFRSMGLRENTITLLALVIAAFVALNMILAYFVVFYRNGAAALQLYRRAFGSWRKFALVVLAVIFGFTSATVFAWSFYVKDSAPVRASKCIPAYRRVTMYSFFKDLGLREPTRDELLMRMPGKIDNYPRQAIRRREDRKKYNVVWLVCESWRADMLTPEIMPRTWAFAEKYGVRFTRNFSGGNNTRMGVFSVFYGLYGSYWHSFLAARRGPLLIDWLIADGYDIRCITSAKFSYPEFDNTVFARLPGSSLVSDDDGMTFVRDIRNTKRLLDFITGDHRGAPFMAFMFFESPHYPYEFPPENAVFKPFVDKVDYLELGPAHSEEIKNRYRNCCRTLDGFLGQVFDTLEKRGMLDDTIVVLLGDHGEEFFEHGKSGHGQNFSCEQTRTPLVLHLPGRKPGVYDGMSSHLDVPAMLAPYLGVENPAADFSHGIDLLAPNAPKRRYTVITQWSDSVFFAGEKYKMQLPIDEFDSIAASAYDADDRELPDKDVAYREYRGELMEVLRDLHRFE